MRSAALDIGGANVKGSLHEGPAFTIPFELWRRPADLCEILQDILRDRFKGVDLLAVTMTGELCDCFETKADGVRHILESLRRAHEAVLHRAEIRVWRIDSTFASLESALREPLACAATNWLALACWAGEMAPRGGSILLDVGSTTTDIIPLRDGRPVPRGRTDTERLETRELVYTGASRTPVAAILRELPYRGRCCPVSTELFATSLDAHLLLGFLPEDADSRTTADGREATRARARDRLARMICADRVTFSEEDALRAAGAICDAQVRMIQSALDVVSEAAKPVSSLIVSGSGEFLARLAARPCAMPIVAIGEQLGPASSAAAPAVALAKLAFRWKQSRP